MKVVGLVYMCFFVPVKISGVFLNESLFWTSNSNKVYFQHGTSQWIAGNSVPSTDIVAIGDSLQRHIGMSYDYRRQYVVFSDKGAKTIFFIFKYNGQVQGAYVHVGTSSTVGHVAVDWISGNVYWADSTFGWIGLQALPKSPETAAYNDKFKVIVDTYLDIPSGVAVHPQKRFLFWSDIGKQPKIERSNLDGSSRNVLIWLGVIRPISLVVDHMRNTLYWTDTVRGTVESCDFYGKNRKILVTSFISKFYGIDVYKDHVLVSDQAKKEIKVLAVNLGDLVPDPVQTADIPFSVSMYSVHSQPWTSDACNSTSCGDICLSTLSSAKCVCEDGYQLDTDQRNCIADTYVLDKTYLLTNGSNICILPVTTINSHPFIRLSPSCGVFTTGLQDIKYIAVNTIDKELYFANEINFNIYRQRPNSQKYILYTSNNKIKGLSFDWTTKEIFWTEEQDDSIHKSQIYSDVSVTINNSYAFRSGIDSPRSLTIDPIGRTLFWISGGSQAYKIQSANLDTPSGNSTIIETKLVFPNRLTYSRRMDRLFWTDTGNLGSTSPDGTGISIESLPDTMIYTGITTYKDYLMWMSKNSSGVYMTVEDRSNTTSPERETFKLPYLDQAADIQMFDRSIQPEFAEPCVKDNGGCQHICIVEDFASRCKCQFGYTLNSDGKTCISNPLPSNFFTVIDELTSKIYQIHKETGATETINIDKSNVPSSCTYDPDTRKIVWCDKIEGKLKISNINGTSETTLTTAGITSNSHVAVDPATGNIYFTKEDSISVMFQDRRLQKLIIGGLKMPTVIALYSKEGKMFWAEVGTQSSIKQVNMDGTSAVEVLVSGTNDIQSPKDIAVDFSGNAVIWCDNVLDKIERIDLKTYQRTVLRSNVKEYPAAIAVDSTYVYYISNGQRTITRIKKFDGTGATAVISSPLYGKLTSLSIILDTPLARHELCSQQNGLCSKFCLPKGKERTCGCPDRINLKDDGRTCVGDVVCPSEIKNGYIDNDCLRYAGYVCSYECIEGYSINATQPSVTCRSNGSWGADTDKLCIKVSCKANINSGRLVNACGKSFGDVCGYSCDDGYKRNTDIQKITCQSDGRWDVQGKVLCSLEAATDSHGLIIGVSVGSVVVVIIIVGIVIICLINRVRKERENNHNPPPSVFFTSEFKHKSLSASQQSSDSYYTETRRNEDTESVYDEIQENRSNEIRQEASPGRNRKRKPSDRYSSFPGNLNQNAEYLDLSPNSFDVKPHADYIHPSSDVNIPSVIIQTSGIYLTPTGRQSMEVPDADYD